MNRTPDILNTKYEVILANGELFKKQSPDRYCVRTGLTKMPILKKIDATKVSIKPPQASYPCSNFSDTSF